VTTPIYSFIDPLFPPLSCPLLSRYLFCSPPAPVQPVYTSPVCTLRTPVRLHSPCGLLRAGLRQPYHYFAPTPPPHTLRHASPARPCMRRRLARARHSRILTHASLRLANIHVRTAPAALGDVMPSARPVFLRVIAVYCSSFFPLYSPPTGRFPTCSSFPRELPHPTRSYLRPPLPAPLFNNCQVVLLGPLVGLFPISTLVRSLRRDGPFPR